MEPCYDTNMYYSVSQMSLYGCSDGYYARVSGTPTVSAAVSTAASDGSSTTGDDASSEASMPGSLSASLNPLADVFRSKNFWSSGCVYMNGDIGKLPSGAVYATTPENLPLATPVPNTDYSLLNGVSEAVDSYSSATSPEGETVGGGGGGGTLGASATGPGPVPASNPSATNVPVSTPGPPPTSALEIPLEQLKQLLSSQLEYYFSRENLANDTYLLSQMDNDQYVPIWTVANFNQVKKLTNDIKLITEVLRESPNVQVDEEGLKVRPNHKRCIVILREIPDNTPLEEVKNLFSGEGCPRLISCEFAHNSSWYVTFESDEDAQRAYRFLREEVREFQGKPIMARIKAKARLPMAPVASVVAGSAMGPMKNGYRTPPPGPATPATPSSGAMYDPSAGVAAAYQNSPQRFLFTNGTHLPPSVNYGNQVQIYTFQQHHFFPPGIMQPWPPNASYFDLGNVFSVNGISQQGSFPKPPGSRYNAPRGNRNRRNQGSGDRGHMSDTGMSRHSLSHHHHAAPIVSAATKSSNIGSSKGQHMVPSAAGDMPHHPHSRSHGSSAPPSMTGSSGGAGVVADGGDVGSEDGYRQGLKDPLPPRRRRKDDEVSGGSGPGGPPGRGTPLLGKPSTAAGGNGSPQPVAHSGAGAHGTSSARTGPQFDLEPNAFPPLPGLDGASAGTVTTKVSSTPDAASTHLPDASPAQSHWENRLADVVKGTAKSKPPSSYSSASSVSSSTKDKEVGNSPPASPAPASTPASTPAPTPAPVPAPAPATPVPASTTPVPASTAPATPAVSTASSSTSTVATATASTETSAPVTSPGPLPPPVVSAATSTTDAAAQQQQTSQTAAAATTTTTDSATATVATPPTSPEKVVPVAKTCSTADKSTKTDESLLDSEERPRGTAATEAVATQGSKQQTVTAASVAAKPVPTTTNAATMTSSVMTEASFTGTSATCSTASQAAPSPPPPGEPVRLSYAQVAQHHKEKVERMQREEKETVNSSTNTTSSASSRVCGQSHAESRERDFRDGPARYSGRGPNSSNGSGRQERGGFRRRDGPVRYRDSRDGGRGEPRDRDGRDGGRDGGRGDGRDSRETLHPRSPK